MCVFVKTGVSLCTYEDVCHKFMWGTCARVCMCGCMPQHLCGGQSRSCRSLFSPSTVWQLRSGFMLSYLPTLSRLTSCPT